LNVSQALGSSKQYKCFKKKQHIAIKRLTGFYQELSAITVKRLWESGGVFCLFLRQRRTSCNLVSFFRMEQALKALELFIPKTDNTTRGGSLFRTVKH